MFPGVLTVKAITGLPKTETVHYHLNTLTEAFYFTKKKHGKG